MKPTRAVLAGPALSMLLSSLGTSIANVALPAVAAAFGATFGAVRWIVLAYLLATTGSAVAAGRLGDRFGRRRMLLVGLGVFTASSVASGVAPTLAALVAARALQGIGAALMMSLSVAAMREMVAEERTGSAMGLLGSTSAIGTALGPALGGLLIDLFGWRSIFLVNVPLGLLALALVRPGVTRDQQSTASPRPVLASSRGLMAGLVASFLVATVLMATLVVGPFYLANTLRLDAALAGAVMAIGPLVAAGTGVPAGRLVDRLGARRGTLAGLGTIAAGSTVLALAPEALGVLGYLAPTAVVTGGYALFQTANNTAVMGAAGPEQGGVASGLLNLSRNLGLIAGAALMSEVFSLGVGSSDVASASAAATAAGARLTFGVATALLLIAIGAVSRPQERSTDAFERSSA